MKKIVSVIDRPSHCPYRAFRHMTGYGYKYCAKNNDVACGSELVFPNLCPLENCDEMP